MVALMAGITAEGIVANTGASAIQAATSVAFSVGVWQVFNTFPKRKVVQILCGLLRLQFILSYFSAPLVSGFTTGNVSLLGCQKFQQF